MQETTKATALKAYLKTKNISPSSLAKRCNLRENYLSMLLNGQRVNPSLPVLVRIATELNLNVHTIQELLLTSYNAYLLEASDTENKIKFQDYLKQILDALDFSDFLKVTQLNNKIVNTIPESQILKSKYIYWFEAFNLAFKNKFEDSIPKFIDASQFTPRDDIEKRFKAKILGGLGAAYTARGKYHQGMKAFRQSLLLWSKGFQAAWVYMNQGTLYRRLDKFENSLKAYERACELGTSTIKVYALVGLIQISLDKKDYNAARRYVINGYVVAKSVKSLRGKCDLYCNIAEYYFSVGQLQHSEFYFRKAVSFANMSGDYRTKHWAMVELAVLMLAEHSVEKFDFLIHQLESELTSDEDVLLIGKHLNTLGKKYLYKSDYLQVISIAGKAYKLLISIAPKPCSEIRVSCMLLWESYQALKVPDSAEFYLKETKRLRDR